MRTIRLIPLFAVMLFSFIANAQTEEIDKAKSVISELLKNKAKVLKTLDKDDPDYRKDVTYPWGTQINIVLLEDRIVFTRKKKSTIIYFSELGDYEKSRYINDNGTAGVSIGEFVILLDGKENGAKLADNIFYIEKYYIEKQNAQRNAQLHSQLAPFQSIATHYRTLQVKPIISEEQRKYIVQANSSNEQKLYGKAIEFYEKAIEVDPTAYPAAYSNLALLYAQLNKFDAAIYNMKKYLMLVPEAEDARSCQDKIYEWEAMMQK